MTVRSSPSSPLLHPLSLSDPSRHTMLISCHISNTNLDACLFDAYHMTVDAPLAPNPVSLKISLMLVMRDQEFFVSARYAAVGMSNGFLVHAPLDIVIATYHIAVYLLLHSGFHIHEPQMIDMLTLTCRTDSPFFQKSESVRHADIDMSNEFTTHSEIRIRSIC